MGFKSKRKKCKGTSVPDYGKFVDEALPTRLSALLDEGRYHQSLEVVREIRRRGLLDGHRVLAERAYRLRALELVEKGLVKEAGVIVENAVSQGFKGAQLASVAAAVSLAAGETRSARKLVEHAAQDSEMSACLMADLAVLASPAAPREMEEPTRAEVDRVLRAFQMYEGGRDAEAKLELAVISKRSPLARWRLLLRGLIARVNGDTREAEESWRRIPFLGPCGLAARVLLGASPSKAEGFEAAQARGGDPRLRLLQGVKAALQREAQTS